MRRWLSALWLTCGLAVVGAVGCSVGVASPDAGCRYGGWSEPRDVGFRDSLPQDPFLAWDGTRAMVVGSGLVDSKRGIRKGDPVPEARLVVHGLEGGGGPWPDLTGLAERFALLNPMAVFDPEGTLHVFWGEPDTLPARVEERTFASPATLWHAHLTPEGRWSEPLRLAGPYERISWTRDLAELAVDRQGRIHVFAPVIPATAPSKTLHLVETEDGWRTGEPFPRALYISALLDLETPLAAYAAGSKRFGRNALFLARFRDGAWVPDDTTIAVSVGRRTIHFVKLLRAGDDVHLLWARSEAIGGYSEVFHRYRRGERWSEPTRIELEVAVPFLGPVVDRCGGLHLTYAVWDTVQELSEKPVALAFRYRRWREEWSGDLTAPSTLFAAQPSVGLAPGGEPLVVWSTVVDSSASGPARIRMASSRLRMHAGGERSESGDAAVLPD